MENFFNMESPIFGWMAKLADRMLLNILFLISSIPIITIGPALAALYHVTGRIQRDEGNIWKDYWSAFCSNFKQATAIWLILLVSGMLIGFSVLFYIQSSQVNNLVALVLIVIGVLPWLAIAAWVFPLQARFENSIRNTIKNALICGLLCLPRTLAAAVINFFPVIILLFEPEIFLLLALLWLVIWFSAVAAINMTVFRKKFEELESMSSD